MVETAGSIRSCPYPACFLCGSTGETLYADLRDRLFDAPGLWTLKRCPAKSCGLAWLDPMPLTEDLPLAYARYYTHASAEEAPSLARRVYRLLLKATPLGRERQRLALMYLDQRSPGLLLDVGCGDGQRLLLFRSRGWQVEGQEVDATAAEQAGRRGLRVHHGALEALHLSAGQFDAITLNHVIEHVADPVALLAECERLLKPAGALVLTTPNIASDSHQRFGRNWRGLEPPRHLHLFTPKALGELARKSGFAEANVWTSSARAVGSALASFDLQRDGQHQMGASVPAARALRAVCFQIQLLFRHWRDPGCGDECILQAVKS